MERKTFIQYGLIVSGFIIGIAFIIQKIPAIESGIGTFFGILTPFYVGFAIAYILNPILTLLQVRFKLKRGMAIAATYLILLVFIGFFGWWIVPQALNNTLAIVDELTAKLGTLQLNSSVLEKSAVGKYLNVDLSTYVQKAAGFANLVITNLSSLLLALTSALFSTFVGLIISIYMAISKDKVIAGLTRIYKRAFPKDTAREIQRFANEANTIFSKFLIGLIIESLIVGILAFIGLSLMGVKYALTLALIICVTNVIPYFGPFIGAVPAVVATALYNPSLALWVVLLILVLQQFDANFIGPRIMGNSVGISPLWIMFFILVFGTFWGAAGMILAIPLGALTLIIAKRVFEQLFSDKPVGQKKKVSR